MTKQKVYGPHRSPEKTVPINKHIYSNTLILINRKNHYFLFWKLNGPLYVNLSLHRLMIGAKFCC